MTPTADRLTQHTMIQTLAAIRDMLDRINERMEEDERHREAAEQAELMYLRRIANELRPPFIAMKAILLNRNRGQMPPVP